MTVNPLVTCGVCEDCRAGRDNLCPDRQIISMPPREGAFALAKALADLHQNPAQRGAWEPPRRIVYVSCNPATLARDAGLLVHQAGYRCVAAGVVNMFAHTAHVESMAVFELDPARVPGAQAVEEAGGDAGS